MKINLWYSKHSKEWRWTLTSEEDAHLQESGGRCHLEDAMSDVAKTVKYVLDNQLPE
jgi:hypothetical protein